MQPQYPNQPDPYANPEPQQPEFSIHQAPPQYPSPVSQPQPQVQPQAQQPTYYDPQAQYSPVASAPQPVAYQPQPITQAPLPEAQYPQAYAYQPQWETPALPLEPQSQPQAQQPTYYDPQAQYSPVASAPVQSVDPSYSQYQPGGAYASPAAVDPALAYDQTYAYEGSRSYLTAFVLSLFFGGLGIDRFYLGYVGTGVVKLLTFGGLGIWYLVDLITIFRNNKNAKDGTSLSGYLAHKRIATIILPVMFLTYLGLAIVCFLLVSSFFNTLDKGVTIKSNGNGTTSTIIGTENNEKADNDTITSLGSAITAENFSVTVTQLVLNPQTTGDSPDTGSLYLQVDLLLDNATGAESNLVPGTFFYRTSSGKELSEARVLGTDAPNKNVQVVGRQTMTAAAVEPGKTDDTRSLLFQIPQGDEGHVVWRDGIFDKEGTKFGTFELFF